MKGPPGWTRFVEVFKAAGIVAAALLAVGSLLAAPAGLLARWANSSVVASIDSLRMDSRNNQTMMRAEISRLSKAALSNRTMILMLADMNTYPIDSPRRRALLEEIKREDRKSVKDVEP